MTDSPRKSRSLAGIAGVVAIATLISKVFGLVREQAIARAFGVGPVVDAYAYAYIIPGFLLILLGGINGPFHSALVSILAKRDQKDAAPLVETVSTLVTGGLLLITVLLVVFAGFFIDLVAPGLEGTVRELAILQLQIMAPLAVFAGLIGIGFGVLNASDQYWLPGISPLFSSLSVVIGVSSLIWILGEQASAPEYMQLGCIVLAGTTLIGAVWQWLAQVFAQWKSGLGTLRPRLDLNIPGVKDVMRVMLPATLSSGMLHINVYTDMYFASYIESAAAAMRYANFIVLTPLGIISNMILVPLLPVFSRLAAPENWDDLKIRIRQGLLLTALSMLPLSAIFVSQARTIIRIIYEYNAFAAEATAIVAPVLMAYGMGMFFYLGRDVLVRVFYGLGDGVTPSRISVFNIFLNAFLDFILVNQFQTPGLVFATIGVNIFSIVMMLGILNRRLGGLPLGEWGLNLLGLTGAAIAAGFVSWGISLGVESLSFGQNLYVQGLELFVAIAFSLVVFFGLASLLKLPELDIFWQRIKGKLKRR
ncbi:murein biosynthesis integral membrane protein MurJ [Picosynechococcus sp. PCC 73109]|uniref:murein biosynthesis integral membrane protein MurJ n=1 Tax=Picosynechococcus sp. PCC 73109 TaxID=374982 RepID=UPI0007458926|nr:murein biosynthesis integral membrane protein MurJ [Picosynechococcus sp. PCC 73109]AMA07975.1 murein biosynthesis protein MurJ [Picosynechococcus sp. PCC 73109]